MTTPDVRWIQRFKHFSKALSQLTKFIEKGALNEFEQQGLIQSFEYTYELAWNTLKDYFEAQGETNMHGSRDVFRLAFKRGLVEDGETWMDMITSRILTSHTYNEDVAEKIAAGIVNRYFPAFVALQTKLSSLKEETA
ncbi:MAG TPA: nucleotidyltransferase substrate binding protein [Candidatus Brocadiaceae bacterium]|nr:nucleotidyltransferase substrate binding protein [Candidatus Brocadiaceae bacterium]